VAGSDEIVDVRVDDWAISVGLRLQQRGPVVLREPVTEADLIDPFSEAWLEGVLRKGRTHVELDTLRARLVPLFAESGATCLGYTVEVEDPAGHTGRREFTIHSLDHVASRAARRLVDRGEMHEGDLYYFVMLADRDRGKPTPAATDVPALAGEVTTRQIRTLDVPLDSLLDESRTVGPPTANAFKVLYTEAALARAESLARKGADSDPPVETGGVLIGSLARCPDSGDLFVLVLDVLEAADADEQRFSLYYSSQTWGHIQAVMHAMQSQSATCTRRIVGQTHGHNFLPDDGAPPCEVCPRLAVCGRSSVFVSQDDISWSRAVFRRQPWHLDHIFGLNARREPVQGLFGLRDGRLLERGFHVIHEFPFETQGD
jgi:hypothetical protein